MGRYLNERVVQLLRAYLKFCGACGFVVYWYNEDKKRIETTRLRRRAGLFFASVYVFFALISLVMMVDVPYSSCKFLIFNISMAGVQCNVVFIGLLQRFYNQRLIELLNGFPVILRDVHNITRREIVFSRMFGIRSVLQFVPMLIILFHVIISQQPFYAFVFIFVVKVLPDILVEMLHHTVYIALYAVAKMYENLNETLPSKRLHKLEKILRVYCDLHRFTEKLNKYLCGYFLLHFFVDCLMLSALIVTISLQCYTMRSMLFLAASTVNRMRALMTVADEISDRSRFFSKTIRDHPIEFSRIQVHLRLCGAYAIDKKLFMSVIAKIFLFLIVTSQYLYYTPDGYNNYINGTHPFGQ